MEPVPVDNSHKRSRVSSHWSGILIVIGVALIILVMIGLYLRAARLVSHRALNQSLKPVRTTVVKSAKFQPIREYVGTTDSWNEAKIGPQYVAAYVSEVLYRPGAAVQQGEVLATLDCRFTSASSQEVAARKRAVVERQVANRDEAQRVQQIAAGGFASVNEVEQLHAKAASDKAEAEGLRANLVGKKVQQDDCVLRAPFYGEIIDRFVDPGAYIRPGEALVTIADRSTIRVVADAPENDFAIVAPQTRVEIAIEAIKNHLSALISRRTPATDPSTRTVHFEMDIDNRGLELPIGATARIRIAVGNPQQSSLLPLQAATLQQQTATLFTVADNVAHKREVKVLGERQGLLYLDSSLVPGTEVVLEGRALLSDGDQVVVSVKEGGP